MDPSGKSSAWHRLRVLVLGIGLGAVFASFVALKISSGRTFSEWAGAWVWVMAGPIPGLDHSWLWYRSPCLVVCLFGLLVIPAHPIRPNRFTALLTLFGLMCWFFLGLMEVLVQYVV